MAPNRSIDPATRLRLAREAKGLSIRQVAETTKLSTRVIEALEGGRISSLPEGIYRRGIVRSVAREVGLDPEQTLREFSGANPDALPPPAAAVVEVAPTGSGRSFQRALAFVGAILPLLAGVVHFGWPATRPSDVPPVNLSRSTRTADGWRPEIVPAGGFSEAPPPLPRPVVVTLTISSKCQLRIVADGRVMLGRSMEQGETLAVELGNELVLLGDNAGAVQFSINGQAGRLLGQPGDGLSVRIGRDDYEDFLVRH